MATYQTCFINASHQSTTRSLITPSWSAKALVKGNPSKRPFEAQQLPCRQFTPCVEEKRYAPNLTRQREQDDDRPSHRVLLSQLGSELKLHPSTSFHDTSAIGGFRRPSMQQVDSHPCTNNTAAILDTTISQWKCQTEEQ